MANNSYYVIAVDPKSCKGCRICEIACSLYHDGEGNPNKSRIRVRRREEESMVIDLPVVCQQCVNSPCREVCPTGAIVESNGPSRIQILADECNGCGMCVEACPLGAVGVIYVCENANVAQSCDLCQGNPKCVSLCPADSLNYKVCKGADESEGVGYMLATLKAMGFAL